MESNRQGIAKEPAPTAILLRKVFSGEVQEKGSAECVLEVVGIKLVPDSQGNEVKKIVIKIKSIKKFDYKNVRAS